MTKGDMLLGDKAQKVTKIIQRTKIIQQYILTISLMPLMNRKDVYDISFKFQDFPINVMIKRHFNQIYITDRLRTIQN